MLQSLTNSQKFLEDISLEDYILFGWMMEYLRYLKCLENAITKGPLVKKQVDQIPKKPGVYTLLNRAGNPIYVGSSRKGERRLEEHLRQQDIPGVAHFRFQQTPSAREAKPLEKRLIKRHKPKYNDQLKD